MVDEVGGHHLLQRGQVLLVLRLDKATNQGFVIFGRHGTSYLYPAHSCRYCSPAVQHATKRQSWQPLRRILSGQNVHRVCFGLPARADVCQAKRHHSFGDVVAPRAVVGYLKDKRESGVTEEDGSCRQEATKGWLAGTFCKALVN